jgi:DNA-binding transcriptional ArsR family regulator
MGQGGGGRRDRSGGDSDSCELYCFNAELVGKLRRSLPGAEEVGHVEKLFSALSSRTRLLIVHCLAQADELCVCDIANALEMNLSTVSHQLRHLRALGLVTFRSEGRMAFYRIADRRVADLVSAELAGSEIVATAEREAAGPEGE